jgi:nicotinamide-nucleotide amidase
MPMSIPNGGASAGERGAAEILCIGTELLLGEILNSNAQFLAQGLAALGIPHHVQTVVGDNIERIHQALRLAQTRSSIVLVTGGLGPTPDDLTHTAIASCYDVPLMEFPGILEEIEAKFAQRGRIMAPSNRKQAAFPKGSTVLPNPTGSAPGIIWEPVPNFTILTFPGVPREMHAMWQETAVPYLRSRGWGQQVFHSRVLRHWGIPESDLAEKVGDLFDSQNPTVAPYAGKGEVRLRVTARAASEEEALALMQPTIEQLQQIAGADCYGMDDDTLAAVVGSRLQAMGQTVAVAEATAGGWIAQQFTAVPGSSGYFKGSLVAYENALKQELLGVAAETLEIAGAVSAEVARQMAVGIRRLCRSDWGIGETGIAGPTGGTDSKPVGLSYIAIAAPDGSVTPSEHRFGDSGGRDWVRWMSTQTALDQLRRQLPSLA